MGEVGKIKRLRRAASLPRVAELERYVTNRAKREILDIDDPIQPFYGGAHETRQSQR